jgi:hypothetical protein
VSHAWPDAEEPWGVEVAEIGHLVSPCDVGVCNGLGSQDHGQNLCRVCAAVE